MTEDLITGVIPTSALANAGSSMASSNGGSIALEVIEGPMDGTVLSSSSDVVHLGRHLENDLSLHGDVLVSSHHASLRCTEDPMVWTLEDLETTNGTWAANAQLLAPHPIRIGSVFLLGQSVIRSSAAEAAAGTVTPEQMIEEKSRLLTCFSPAMKQAYGSATMIACRERRGFVNDRHFLLGLAMTEADLPILERGQGPISFDLLNGLLLREVDWTGVENWIDERLQDIPISNFFAINLPLSPRVLMSLLQAEQMAHERGRKTIEPVDWFRAVFSDPQSRTCKVLGRHGLLPQELLAELGSVPSRPDPHTLGAAPSFPREGTDSVTRTDSVSSGDKLLDDGALELVSRLYGVAARYHLAEPATRRGKMREILTKEIAQLGVGRNRQLLEQVRRLFPIDVGSRREAEEIQRLQSRIAELEHRVSEFEVGPEAAPVTSGLPWDWIVEPGGEEHIQRLSPQDRPRLHFLRRLYVFSQGLETAVVNMVQDFTAKGAKTTTIKLPGHPISIRAYVSDLRGQRPVRIEALEDYFTDLETWLAAGLMAYHEGPKTWFEKFWKKASPASIEAREAGIGRRLGLTQWQRYKETVRKISPDFVTQQILYEVGKIAQDRRDQFAQGRQKR